MNCKLGNAFPRRDKRFSAFQFVNTRFGTEACENSSKFDWRWWPLSCQKVGAKPTDAAISVRAKAVNTALCIFVVNNVLATFISEIFSKLLCKSLRREAKFILVGWRRFEMK